MANAMAGSLIMDAASMFFLGGILIYTSLYRKRGRLDDRLFFAMVIINMVMAAVDGLSFLQKRMSLSVMREIMMIENTLFYAGMGIFPWLFLLYLDFRVYRDQSRLRKIKLLFGIPCLALLAVLILNLWTGWIFSVSEDNTWHSGPVDEWIYLPLLFYFVMALILTVKIDIRMVFISLLLAGFRFFSDRWIQGISSMAFTYTLFLVCTHIHVMNSPLTEETT